MSQGFPLSGECIPPPWKTFIFLAAPSFARDYSGHMANCHQMTVNVVKQGVNKNLFRAKEYKVICLTQAEYDENCGWSCLVKVQQTEASSVGDHETETSGVWGQVSGGPGGSGGPRCGQGIGQFI